MNQSLVRVCISFHTVVSGLLRVGDIVKEVNGIPVFVPEDMMIVLKEAENSITFKIVPSAMDQQFSDPVSG